jgi:uncharacterized protein YlxW (UPF0749 family)
MGLQEKIEEIRRKPEYIRIRYVWMWVGISMVFVIAIWIVSIVVQNRKTETTSDISNQQLLEQFKDQKKSLEDTTNQIKNMQGKIQPNMQSIQKQNSNNPNTGEGMNNQ